MSDAWPDQVPDDDVDASIVWPHGVWTERVTYADGAAVQPGRLLVAAERAADVVDASRADDLGLDLVEEGVVDRLPAVFAVPGDLLDALDALRRRGLAAQPNHVLFAQPGGVVSGRPVWSKPVWSKPVWSKPELESVATGGCGCCPPHPSGSVPDGDPVDGPTSAVVASPVWSKPVWSKGYQASGERPSTAVPTDAAPSAVPAPAATGRVPSVVVLDTGLAAKRFRPASLAGIGVLGTDLPDESGDGYLDPVAGHGTFIAGLLRWLAPGAAVVVHRVLSTMGDGDELTIAKRLDLLADVPWPVDVVNLSFGGYGYDDRMDTLARAVRRLVNRKGCLVVAAAGNDATCRPLYPAAFPEVVAVAALDGPGAPAAYTNFGPWVDAAAPGTDLVSTFFEGWNGVATGSPDPDDLRGAAVWSGTSFAAPVVSALVARHLLEHGGAVSGAAKAVLSASGQRLALLGAQVLLP